MKVDASIGTLSAVLAEDVFTIRAGASAPHQLEDQDHLSRIIDSAPSGMILVNETGAIELVNQEVEKMFGYSRTELLGRSVETILPELLRENHPNLRASPMGVGRNLSGRRKDGSEFPLEIGLNPLSTTTGTWVLSSVIDITERKIVEAKIQDSARLKSEFLANMSHEIRTPMNVIMGMSSLMLDTELSSEQRTYAEMISVGAESLLTIINDILDFSKIEAGKLEIADADFDLSTTVEEATIFLSEAAGRKDLELTCRSDPDGPALRGDATRIRQVLINIIGNAVKFTDRGEVNVTATWEPLVSDGEEQRVTARFEVRDTGIGITEATGKGLFEVFSQGDGSLTRKHWGTGLGLAISKKLVGLMDGEIGWSSEPGRGSLFWFSIPLKRSGRVETRTTEEVSTYQHCRALVVDDHETNRQILASQLSRLIQVSTAKDATEGLNLLRAACAEQRPFDVAIVDYGMPGINGLDLARIIRSDNTLQATPVVLVTSYSGDRVYDEARRLGVNLQIGKPVQSRDLRQTLSQVLAPRQAPQPIRSKVEPEPSAPLRTLPRLLLVEDNSDNRFVASSLLLRLGYETDQVQNGMEALRAVQCQTYPLVFMDLQMPLMDGWTAATAIRSWEGVNRRVKIVAMTANAMVGDRERCLAAGMDDYVSKPLRPKELEDLLRRWL